MNLPRRPLLFASFFLVALAAPRQPLEFRPREGSELVKRFETRLSLALDDLTLEVNGEELDPTMFLGGLDLDAATVDLEFTLGVRDTYVRLGGGRPLELLRAFESGALTAENGIDGGSEEKDHDLVGRTVRFEWDPEAESYGRSFEGEAGDEDHIEYLAEDMDLRDLLSPDEVESGDSWELSWSEHLALVLPGYDLDRIDPEDLDLEDEDIPPGLVAELIDSVRGAFADAIATCTFRGLREVDGVELGVVSIASEIEARIDLRSVLDQLPPEAREQASFDRFDLALSIELTGELLWDVAAGHFRSFELAGPLSGSLVFEASVDQDGMQIGAYATAEFSGDLERSATTE